MPNASPRPETAALFPTDLASFLDLIRQHGTAVYSFLFAYAASHSLLIGLFAGYAAHAGALELGRLIAVCWLGSFLGDVLRFWIGRKFGMAWLARWPNVEKAAKVVVKLAETHHVWMILAHRWPHGIRGVAAFAYGMAPLPLGTFLFLNFIAAGLWAAIVVSIGYGFGQVSEKVLQDASSHLGLAMLAIFLGLSWYLSKKLERVIERS